MLEMKWLALILGIMLALGAAQGYPLQGSNGKVDCIIFGAFKTPFNQGDVNYGKNVIFSVDLGVVRANDTENATEESADDPSSMGTNGSGSSVDMALNSTYTLVDGNDRVYSTRPEYTRDLQPERVIIGFIVPKEAVAKSLIIDPTVLDSGGERFEMDFSPIANASNTNVTLLYYGGMGTKIDSNKKYVNFDIGLTNNGTGDLPLSTSNFSLLDQWGWKYSSKKYNKYNGEGFDDRVLRPNETFRTGLAFGSISVLSRPSKLIYQYSKDSSLIIDIDKEEGINTSLLEPGVSSEGGGSEPASTTLAGEIKATKARLAKVKEKL